MKRYIRTSSLMTMTKNAAEARRKLKEADPKKVELVHDCYQDVLDDINEFYQADEAGYEASIHTSEIKRDWLISAIEDDLMTEEEFNELYACFEAIGTEDAHSVA